MMIRPFFLGLSRLFGALVILSVVAACALAGSDEASGRNIDSAEYSCPYRMCWDPAPSVPSVGSGRRGATIALLDLDGDGRQEYLHSNRQGLLSDSWEGGGPVTKWQLNLPPEFSHGLHSVFITDVGDVDGDGSPEVSLIGHKPGPGGWRLWILKPDGPDIIAEYDLPEGEDRRLDGKWDGSYRVMGSVPHPEAGSGRALILLREVAFDLEPRGILALDPLSGEEIWRYDMGCNPDVHGTRLADLDGDGRDEVMVAGNAPDNMGGRLINGTSDDMLHLIVLSPDGRLLWRREICPAFAHGTTAAADLDGDGFREVCLAIDSSNSMGDGIFVFDSESGEQLHHLELDRLTKGLAVAEEIGGGDLLFVGSRLGDIFRVRLIDGDLSVDRRAAASKPAEVLFSADVLPEPGPEILVGITQGVHFVLDRDLRVMARQPDIDSHFRLLPFCAVWEIEPGEPRLLVSGADQSPGAAFRFEPEEPAPMDLRWLFLAAIPFAAGAVAIERRRRRSAPHSLEDRVVKRDLMLRLLGDLELSGHGQIGALRSLRRVVWLCEALNSAAAERDDLRQRLIATWSDCRKEVLPSWKATLVMAGQAGIATALTDPARRTIDGFADAIESLSVLGFPAEKTFAALPRIKKLVKAADDASQDLRSQVESHFRTDVGAAVDRVLLAQSEVIKSVGAEIRRTIRVGDGPYCRIDSGELAFVVDNLVANSLRAMSDAPLRRLTINWTEIDNMVEIRFADTGCGIAPADRRRVMESRASRRPGGGLGLPRSVQILAKYGATLKIEESRIGAGATFLLSVPCVV